jgi:hypothetical protein
MQINSQDLEEEDLGDYIASYHRSCVSKRPEFMYAKFRLDKSELQQLEKLVLPFSSSLDGKVTDLKSIVRFSDTTLTIFQNFTLVLRSAIRRAIF